MAPGIPTNIGTNSLRMPTMYRSIIVKAVVISPQKAARPVFFGFIFLRSASDNTLIRSGRNSTKTAHNMIMLATNNIPILSYNKDVSIITSNFILPFAQLIYYQSFSLYWSFVSHISPYMKPHYYHWLYLLVHLAILSATPPNYPRTNQSHRIH